MCRWRVPRLAESCLFRKASRVISRKRRSHILLETGYVNDLIDS